MRSVLYKLMQAGMVDHAMFSFAFSLAAIFWAAPKPAPDTFLLVTVAVFSARTAGCLFNNLVDRGFDRANRRTEQRPLADGSLSVTTTKRAIVVLCAVTAAAAWMIDPLYLFLLPIPGALSLFYSYTKRFTCLCHFILGVVCASAPVGAWIVFADRIDGRALVIGAMVASWTTGYDLLYALQDAEFDRRMGLHSIPARYGPEFTLALSALIHVFTAVLFFAWGAIGRLGVAYHIGAVLCSVLLLSEHLILLRGQYSRAHISFSINQVIGYCMLIFTVFDRLF